MPVCTRDFFVVYDVNLDEKCGWRWEIKPFFVFALGKAWTPTPTVFKVF